MKLLSLFTRLSTQPQKPSKLKKARRIILAGLLIIILITFSLRIWEYINPSKTAEAAWYTGVTGTWQFRKKLTIDNTKVAGTSDYTNFPVALSRAFPELADYAQSDGGDIVFTTDDGVTIMSHEVESFDKTTGKLVAWIEIPTLDGDADTTFYMYYGNPDTADMQDIAGMWDTITYSSTAYTFKAVWHMSQNPETSGESILDSAQNSNDADPTGMTQATNSVDAILGKGLYFDGSDDYMIADEDTVDFGTSDFSIILWNKLKNEITGDSQHIMIEKKNGGYSSKANKGWGFVYRDDISNGYQLRVSDGDGPGGANWNGSDTESGNYDDGVWRHLALTIDRNGDGIWYVDSVAQAADTGHQQAQSTLDVSDDLAFCNISNDVGTGISDCGTLDEVWIFLSVVPENIIVTAYNNQYDNNSFFSSYGVQEARKEPRAHWKMDEGSGSTIYDAIGERTDGTATSTTWVTTQANCVMGTCLTFGTADNRVTVSDNYDLDFTAGTSFSLEAWIKHDTASAQQVIVSKYNESGYKLLMESDGDITCGIDYDSTWTPTDSVTSTLAIYDDNNWHHLVCVKNANTSLTLYIDGVSVGTPDTTLTNSTLANTDPFYIGIDADGSSLEWVGSMDEVKLYDYARSAIEILTDYNIGFSSSGSNAVLGRFAAASPPSDTYTSRWKFDEGALNTCSGGSNDFCDSSSNANDLVFSTTTGGFTASGKFANAFNGTGSVWASRADDSDFDFAASDNFTITGWFKSDSATNPGTDEYLVDKETGTGYGIYLTATNGYLTFGIDSDGTWTPQDTTANTTDYYDNNWHHFAAVKTGTTSIELYVDGNSVGSDSSLSATGTLANSDSLTIGDQDAADDGDEFTGDIDELKVYRIALTRAQILVDMNALSAVNFGTGGASESASLINGPPNPPVGYYKLDENTGVSTTYDTSGNGKNGTLTNVDANDWVSGQFGSALSLTAADTEYIEVGTGTTDVETVTFWVKPTSNTDDYINLISTTTYIDSSSGTVQLAGQTGEKVYVNGILNNTITAGIWNHVAVVTSGSLDLSSGNIEIGRVGATPSYLNGVIDEVKLFDSALTQAQVAYDYNRGKPIAWWRMDEKELNWCGTYTDGCDASGFGYDLLAQSNATTVSVPGKYSNGAEFDGTGDYYCLDNADDNSCDNSTTEFQITGDLTLAGWVKFDAATDSATIVYQGENGSDTAANNELFFLRLDTTSGTDIEYGHESGSGTDNYVVFNTNLSTNTWYHLTLVRDTTANTVQLYLNGIPTDTASIYSADPTGGSTGELAIGANDNGTNNWDGTLDDIRIYNYAMSHAQVRTLFNNGSARFD